MMRDPENVYASQFPGRPAAVFALWDGQNALMENRPDFVGNSDEYWVFPGGKLNERETPVQAMRRECLEETGCRVLDWQYLGVGVGANGWYTHAFLVPSWRGEPNE